VTPETTHEAATGTTEASTGRTPDLFRAGKIAYLEIPAVDGDVSAAFYETVFGWTIRASESGEPHFEDTTHDIIGAFVSDRAAAGERGVRPYIYVDGVDAALERILAQGCDVLDDPYPEGKLWVATFRDPAGNVIGIWQNGPR
jgi:predicted enzyme related to lactoylglutathione lyase